MTKTENTVLRDGIKSIMLAVFVMSLQAIAMKSFAEEMPIWQLTVLRSLLVIPVLIVACIRFAAFIDLRSDFIFWGVIRAFCMVLMNFTYYASLPLLTVSAAATAYYISPIITLIMSVFIVGERVNIIGVMAMFLAFFGTILIIDISDANFNFLILLPMLSALAYSCASIITRTKCTNAPPLFMSLLVHIAFLGSGVVASMIVGRYSDAIWAYTDYFFVASPWVPISGKMWLVMVMLAAFNLTTHMGFAMAYRQAPASMIAIWEYTYLPIVTVMAFIMFGELPEISTVLGMVAIILSGFLSLNSVALARRWRRC